MTGLRLPHAPGRLELPLERLWNGAACPDPSLRGRVWLAARPAGIEMAAAGPAPIRTPDAPPGTRVADLFEYDVVECFLAGEGGLYLEVELGPGGRFLVLGFDAPRRLADDHVDFDPELRFEQGRRGWSARIMLPWRIVPPGLRALNAFLIAGEPRRHLAYHPLPGERPDFHQPERFPSVRVDAGSPAS